MIRFNWTPEASSARTISPTLKRTLMTRSPLRRMDGNLRRSSSFLETSNICVASRNQTTTPVFPESCSTVVEEVVQTEPAADIDPATASAIVRELWASHVEFLCKGMATEGPSIEGALKGRDNRDEQIRVQQLKFGP